MAVINNPIQPRPFELIRDRIANILQEELYNQSAINYDELIDATVYTERFIPFDRTDMPCVNVMMTRGNFDNYKAIDKDGTYQYFIDVYHRASSTDIVGGDELAHRNLHRLVGIIDAILSDTRYVTLGYERPFISRVEVTEIKIADPKDTQDAQSVAMGRVLFSVRVPSSVESIEPRLMDGYDTQVKIGLTDSGYIYSGNNIPVPEPTCEPVLIYLANGTVLATVNSSGEFTVPDTPVTVRNVSGDDIGSGDVPSVTGGVVTVPDCPVSGDGTAVLKDTDGNVLSNTPVPPETTVDIIAPDADYEIRKSNNAILYQGSIPSGGALVQDIQDSMVRVRKSNNQLIAEVDVRAESVENYNVSDSTAVLKDSAGTIISTTSIKATETEDIPAPDTTLQVNGVTEGTHVAGSTIGINLSDGVNPLNPDSVTKVGDNYEVVVPAPTTGWVRNPDWLPLPEITAADNRFVGLFLVFEGEYNQTTMQITSAAANIDWGDGTNDVSNGAVQTKVYDYATISSPIHQYYDGRNYKQVIVDVTATGVGTISLFYMDRNSGLNNGGCNNFVDISCSFPSASFLLFSNVRFLHLCERFALYNCANGTSFTNCLQRMTSLRVFEFPWDKASSVQTMLRYSGNGLVIGDINTTATSISGLFQDANLERVGSITALNAANGISLFNNARIGKVGYITLNSATDIQSMFQLAYVVNVGVISTPLANNWTNMFNGTKVTGPLIFTHANFTGNPILQNQSFSEMVFPSLTIGLNISNNNLTADDLLALANSVGNANGSQTWITTGNPGAADLAYIAVFNSKGYTVTN